MLMGMLSLRWMWYGIMSFIVIESQKEVERSEGRGNQPDDDILVMMMTTG